MSQLPVIETKRTVLTILHPDAAPLLLAYQMANKEHLAPWEPIRDSDFYTAESCRRRCESAYQAFIDGTAVSFIALERKSNKMIAGCNFSNIVRGPLQACYLGYSVHQEFEGQGLMHEVAQAAIQYAFGELGLHRIMANHLPSNLRSQKLLGRLGFEREGYARAYLKIAGKWEDMVLNSLINSEG
ncbi:GNAT family N-acetyltransferase [Collimonas pratensis]|uniref:GNAT family N-acetyltransferase n=1 Tax=Collimonas pratensis TaxID=279113 RepID=UPI0007809B98|nr:GNAT family N-acetyltransferase [Collimonas pratensis]